MYKNYFIGCIRCTLLDFTSVGLYQVYLKKQCAGLYIHPLLLGLGKISNTTFFYNSELYEGYKLC